MRPLLVLAVLVLCACGTPANVNCSTLSNSAATTVTSMNVASVPPRARGGPIADGTYERTSTTVYTGVGGAAGAAGDTHRQTLEISGSGRVFKSADSKNGGADEQLVFTTTIGGANVDAALTCGKTGSIRYAYDATATSITLYDSTSSGGVTKVHTYTLQ